ncbi:MAG: RNA 2',3'-cyclic phosphodiesterase [Deltaproteobacteria bacterium]
MPEKRDDVRAFIAIALPEGVKLFLKELLAQLRSYGGTVRWTRVEGIHLTLKFLGNVGRDRLPELEQEVNLALRSQPAMLLHVSGMGAFPGLNRPRVLWVGIDDPHGRVVPMVANLENALERLGFAKEKRPYNPHLTLGRVKSGRLSPDLLTAIRQMIDLSGPSFEADHAVLFQSILKPSGAEYRALSRFNFLQSAEPVS